MIRWLCTIILFGISLGAFAQNTPSDTLQISFPDSQAKNNKAEQLEEQSLSNYVSGKKREAISQLKEANRLRGMAGNNIEKIAHNLLSISQYYYESGDNGSALVYLKLYNLVNGNYKQQLFNNKIEDLERLHQLEVKALEEQRDKAQNLNTQLSDRASKLSRSLQNWKITTISMGLVALILGTIFIIFTLRKSPAEKTEVISDENSDDSRLIEEENKALNQELEESADLIKIISFSNQSPESGLKKIIPDLLIFSKPKGKVGSDFFWHHHFNDNLIIVTGDCNLDGIRGGLVAALVKSILNHTVIDEKLFTPSMVMALIDQQLRQKFLYNEDNPMLGVSLSYLLVNLQTRQIEFAGAGTSIFYSENGKVKIEQGNLLPAGSTLGMERFFNTHTLTLAKGEMVFAFSDGYSNQIGHKEGKRFMREPMRKLLESVYGQKVSEQLFALEKVHNEWKGLKPQTDDMLIIGLRLP